MHTAIDLGLARGHWVAPRTIAWPSDGLPPGTDPATPSRVTHAPAPTSVIAIRHPYS